jgi:hypothetical protein
MRSGRDHGQPFQGVINLDIRDSTPDWAPYPADRAPQGSPNRAQPPERLRHHRRDGDRLPWEQHPHPDGERLLRRGAARAGLEHLLVGKNHNIPVDEFDMGASKRNWPLTRGFDRFYGFIAARPTSGIPTWSRTTTTPTSRTRPRRATTSQGHGGQGDRLHPRLRPGRRPAVAGQPPAAGGRPALTQQRSSPGRPMSGHWPPGGMAGGRRTDDFSRPWGLSCDAEVHVQTAAMPLDPGDLAFAVVLAADLKRQAALRPRKRLECREERSPRPCTQLSVPWTSLRPWTSS